MTQIKKKPSEAGGKKSVQINNAHSKAPAPEDIAEVECTFSARALEVNTTSENVGMKKTEFIL